MKGKKDQWQEKGHLLILCVVQESESWQKNWTTVKLCLSIFCMVPGVSQHVLHVPKPHLSSCEKKKRKKIIIIITSVLFFQMFHGNYLSKEKNQAQVKGKTHNNCIPVLQALEEHLPQRRHCHFNTGCCFLEWSYPIFHQRNISPISLSLKTAIMCKCLLIYLSQGHRPV